MLGKTISGWFDGLFDRVFSVLGAIGLAQFPAYIQQYYQRLGGHVDEAARNVALFREAAHESGRTLEEYIQRFLNETDPDFVRQGEIMQQIVERYETLLAALTALESANLFTRPFVFLYHMHTDIAWNALRVFQPGVPTTLEGLVYALAGILLGLLIYNSIKGAVNKVRGKKKQPGGQDKTAINFKN